MAKILIGDNLVNPYNIESISEQDVTLKIKKTKPNKAPKPKGFFGKLLYSDTVTVIEEHKYHVLVLKVAEGTQLILPDPDDDSDFTIGVSPSYGTHKIYNSYTICGNSKLISDAKALKEECDSIELPNNLNSQSYGTQAKEERRSEIIKTLRQLGMDYSFGGWVYSDYLDAHVLIDKEIKTKRDFIEKYM